MELKKLFSNLRRGTVNDSVDEDEVRERADSKQADYEAAHGFEPVPDEPGVELPPEYTFGESVALSGPSRAVVLGAKNAATKSVLDKIKSAAMDMKKRTSAVNNAAIRDPEMAALASKPGGAAQIEDSLAAQKAQSAQDFNKFKQNNEKYTSNPNKVSDSELNYAQINKLPPIKPDTPKNTLNYKDILAADDAKKLALRRK